MFFFSKSMYTRLMERDNKKAKEDAKREYVDVVRVRLNSKLLFFLMNF